MATEIQRLTWLEEVDDTRVREAVFELCESIQDAFPEAEFRVYHHHDHRGAIIEVYTDSDYAFDVLDRVSDRRVDLLIEEDLAIRLIPLHRRWLRSLATGSRP